MILEKFLELIGTDLAILRSQKWQILSPFVFQKEIFI